jgi:hypothetical protein
VWVRVDGTGIRSLKLHEAKEKNKKNNLNSWPMKALILQLFFVKKKGL